MRKSAEEIKAETILEGDSSLHLSQNQNPTEDKPK
jgi:hypothetical protein